MRESLLNLSTWSKKIRARPGTPGETEKRGGFWAGQSQSERAPGNKKKGMSEGKREVFRS